jgi:hypothetical protein
MPTATPPSKQSPTMPPGELPQVALAPDKQPIIAPDIKPKSSAMVSFKHKYSTPQQVIKHELNMLPPDKLCQDTLAPNNRKAIIKPYTKPDASVTPSSKHKLIMSPKATKLKPTNRPPNGLLRATLTHNKQELTMSPSSKPESSVTSPKNHDLGAPPQATKHEVITPPPDEHSQASPTPNKQELTVVPNTKLESSAMIPDKLEPGTLPQATKYITITMSTKTESATSTHLTPSPTQALIGIRPTSRNHYDYNPITTSPTTIKTLTANPTNASKPTQALPASPTNASKPTQALPAKETYTINTIDTFVPTQTHTQLTTLTHHLYKLMAHPCTNHTLTHNHYIVTHTKLGHLTHPHQLRKIIKSLKYCRTHTLTMFKNVIKKPLQRPTPATHHISNNNLHTLNTTDPSKTHRTTSQPTQANRTPTEGTMNNLDDARTCKYTEKAHWERGRYNAHPDSEEHSRLELLSTKTDHDAQITNTETNHWNRGRTNTHINSDETSTPFQQNDSNRRRLSEHVTTNLNGRNQEETDHNHQRSGRKNTYSDCDQSTKIKQQIRHKHNNYADKQTDEHNLRRGRNNTLPDGYYSQHNQPLDTTRKYELEHKTTNLNKDSLGRKTETARWKCRRNNTYSNSDEPSQRHQTQSTQTKQIQPDTDTTRKRQLEHTTANQNKYSLGSKTEKARWKCGRNNTYPDSNAASQRHQTQSTHSKQIQPDTDTTRKLEHRTTHQNKDSLGRKTEEARWKCRRNNTYSDSEKPSQRRHTQLTRTKQKTSKRL